MGSRITELDSVARRMAATAGVLWDELNDYPGYGKNYWREQARGMIASLSPHAVFIESRGTIWDAA